MMRAAADGYTLGMATVSTTAANPAINPKIAYNPLVDFTPIINIAATPNVIAVHPSFPARTTRPSWPSSRSPRQVQLSPARAPAASATCRPSCSRACPGTFITHIPYRGAGPALNDTVAGQVPIIFDNLPSALPFIKDGRLIPIVVAAPQRLAQCCRTCRPSRRWAWSRSTAWPTTACSAPRALPKEVVDKVTRHGAKTLEDCRR
jgi:tripartite-type tricarboxylate transporter receptor subunit TctC